MVTGCRHCGGGLGGDDERERAEEHEGGCED